MTKGDVSERADLVASLRRRYAGVGEPLDDGRLEDALREVELVVLAQGGDKGAQRGLLDMHAPLIRRIVMRTATKLGVRRDELPDVHQEGRLGFLDAVQRYRPEVGRLMTFAWYGVRAAVQRYVWAKVDLVHAPVYLTECYLRRTPPRTSTAKAAAARIRRHHYDGLHFISLDTGGVERGAGAGVEFVDHPRVRESVGVFEEPADVPVATLVEAALAMMSARERDVVERRLGDDPDTLETIAVDLSLSRERVRQVYGEALEKVRRAWLTKRGRTYDDKVDIAVGLVCGRRRSP